MGTQEFSDQFDVLYNNITSNQAAGLNEYEKSVFLTKAQEEVVKNYFSPKANPKGDGFDDSPKRQADFSTIINFMQLTNHSTTAFDHNSYTYILPSDLFISLNEQLIYKNIPITVVPISYEEYNRLMAKPYKFPPKYQAWRLITKNSDSVIPGTTTYYYTGSEVDGDSIYKNFPITLTVEGTYPVDVHIYGNESPLATGLSEGEVTVTGNSSIGYIVTYKRTLDQKYTAAVAAINANSSFSAIATMNTPAPDTNYANGANNTNNIEIVAQGIKGKATYAEVRGRFDVAPTYMIRYVKRPRPIILTNLGTLQIHNQYGPSECELPEELHEEILQRAVELAKVAWTNNGQDNVALTIEAGKRSE